MPKNDENPTNSDPIQAPVARWPWATWPRWRVWLAGSILVSTLGLAALGGLVVAYLQDLPVVPGPDKLTPSLATKIYDMHGQLITQLAIENRTLVRLDQIPKDLVNAMIALEDRRYWKHWGIDPQGILRAVWVNFRKGRVIEGGSTITQQLAKNLFLTRERSLSRKVKEALLALQVERRFTKSEILEMYFNQIYFGNGAYGVEAAARTYFGKHVQDLDLSECATLAGIPRSPNQNNPIDNVIQATQRRDTALQSMLEEAFVSPEQLADALSKPIAVFHADPVVAAYFVEHVRQQLEASYGANAVYKGGLTVYTTLDLRLQDLAQRAVEKGARDADLKAAPFLEHEFSLKKKPVLQVAFVAIEPRTGGVLAMVGGRDFRLYQFNRATQARRQPGSAFKPFIYTAAIENGFTPADIIMDTPIQYKDEKGGAWTPENFDKEFRGPVTLRTGLAESRNVVTVKLLEKVGIFNAINYAHRMGIGGTLNRDLSLALGTCQVSLLEMVSAFGTLANQGVRVEPVTILSVRDAQGKVLEEASPKAQEALSAASAYIVTSMMQDVINVGTASSLRTQGFTRTAAGKTGTTSDFSDAWFVGFTPRLVAGCWFGYDERRRIGKLLTGGAIAAPVWAEFMNGALATQPDELFPVPAGLKFVRVCAQTGKPPKANCRRAIDEVFLEGSEIQSEDAGMDSSAMENWYEQELGGPTPKSPGAATNKKVKPGMTPTEAPPTGF